MSDRAMFCDVRRAAGGLRWALGNGRLVPSLAIAQEGDGVSSVGVNRHALIAIRERSGVSKAELARMVGAAASTISDIERGHRQPSEGLLAKLASALKVPILALLADPGPNRDDD